MENWIYWLIIAGICFITELFTVGFLFCFIGIGALIALVASLITNSVIIQTITFVISSTALLLLIKPFANKLIHTSSVATNTASLIGKQGIVISDLLAVDGSGQIKVGFDVWAARSDNGKTIRAGTTVTIVNIDGVKAVVKAVF